MSEEGLEPKRATGQSFSILAFRVRGKPPTRGSVLGCKSCGLHFVPSYTQSGRGVDRSLACCMWADKDRYAFMRLKKRFHDTKQELRRTPDCG